MHVREAIFIQATYHILKQVPIVFQDPIAEDRSNNLGFPYIAPHDLVSHYAHNTMVFQRLVIHNVHAQNATPYKR